MRKLTVLSICIVLMLGLSFTTSAVASDEDDVLKVMENWCKASNTSDFELFSSIYSHSPKTSQFHPTEGVPFLYKGWDAIERNWGPTFAEPTGSVEISIHNPDVTMLGKDAAVVAYYELVTSTSATGEESIEQHRITRVLQKIDGKWLIVHDHASNLP